MKKKILYLTVLENTVNNSIHKNQVLLLRKNNFAKTYFLFISPMFILNRNGFFINKNKFKIDNVFEVKVPFLSYNFLLNIFLLPLLLLFCFPILTIYFIRYKFNVVHCRNLVSSFVVVVFRKLKIFNFKIVSDPRSVYPEEGIIVGRWKLNSLNYNVWKKIERFTFNNSDFCIGLSKSFSDYLRQYNVNSVYIPAIVNNYIEFDELLRINGRKKYFLGENDLLLTYVGSIGFWHNIDLLIDMIDFLFSVFPNHNCKILVLTDSKQLINAVTEKYGNCCVFSGQVNTESVHQFLCMSDFGLLPGSNEKGYHYELLYKTMVSSKAEEYLCSGLPIISNSRIAELSEIISSWNCGYVFNSVDRTIDNNFPAVFSSNQRREFSNLAKNEFSFDSVIKCLNDIYIKLL